MVFDEDWPYDIATMSSLHSCLPCAALARAENMRRQAACSSGQGSMTSSCGDAPVPFSPSTVVDRAEEACPDLGWARDAPVPFSSSSKFELRGLLYIGVFGPWRTQQDYEVDPISNWGLNWLSVSIQRGILDEHSEGERFLRWWRLPAGNDDGLGWRWPLGCEVGRTKRKGERRLGFLRGWGWVLAHGQFVIENPFKFLNPHRFKFKIDLNSAWILIVKLNLLAHNNTKDNYATGWMQQP
jgi:hypothetical protein